MPAYSRKVLQQHLRRLDDAPTPVQKGKALEDLACYLFEKVPGVGAPERNRLNKFESEEVDLAFLNEQHPAGLKHFNPFLLVECKNWSSPVGSMEVSWFLQKIERRSLDFGILLAANGITGSAEDGKRAHKIASDFLAKGIRLVVLTRLEIETLRTTKDLVTLIRRKVIQLIVSETVWP